MLSDGQTFVLIIIAISTLGWIVTTAIRARHGYPVEGEWGGTVHKRNDDADARTKALSDENAQLRANVGKLEDRLKVLERIATDPARQLADDIDQLR